MAREPLKIFMDLDPLVYGVGFSAQSTQYEVVWEDDDGLHTKIWEDGNEKLAYFREHKEAVILDEERHTFVQPVEYALGSMKRTLKSIQHDIADHYKCDIMDVHLVPILGGKDNYRIQLAKQKPYKGNRTQPKPAHYDAIRDYLLTYWNAQLTDGNEADDECSIQARDSGGVVATVDKDLDQIPGRHYDYKKKVFYEVEPYDAMLFFYQQAISGDATDNIPGGWGIGTKVATDRIKEATTHISFEWEEDPQEYERILWDAVLNAYVGSMKKKGCPYSLEDIPEIALETARLVKMQEYEDQLWNPPKVPDDSVEEFLDEQRA